MLTVSELAKEIGVNRTNILHHVYKHKLGKKYGHTIILNDDEAALIREHTLKHQQEKGMITVAMLVKETGLSRQVISSRIKSLGIIDTKERNRIYLTKEQAQKVKDF